MPTFKWIPFMLAVSMLHAVATGAGKVVREIIMDIDATPDWILSDGKGGIYVQNYRNITHFHPTGEFEIISSISHLKASGDSFGDGHFVGPKGELWCWIRPPVAPITGRRFEDVRLLRHTSGKIWEETQLQLPPNGCHDLRYSWTDSGELQVFCFPPQYSGQTRGDLVAKVHFPEISPWESSDSANTIHLTHSSPSSQDSNDVWAVSHEAGDTLGLFLATPSAQSWRHTHFTVGPLSGPSTDREVIPFPSGWTGPQPGRSLERFDKARAFIVSHPTTTWIALEGFLALRNDSGWTLFLSQSHNMASMYGSRQTMPVKKFSPLQSTIPFVYTAMLASAAVTSGPGWFHETGSALSAVAVGSVLGGIITFVSAGMCAAPNAACGSGENLLVPMLIIPIPLAIWAIESQKTQADADRKWLRRGAAGLGMLSAVALYYKFPSETRLMIAGGLLGTSLGAVVGYRMAFLP
jgi:hypothetical protein